MAVHYLENHQQYVDLCARFQRQKPGLGDQLLLQTYERHWPVGTNGIRPELCPKCGAQSFVPYERRFEFQKVAHDIDSCSGKPVQLPTDPNYTYEQLEKVCAEHGVQCGLEPGSNRIILATAANDVTVDTLREAFAALPTLTAPATVAAADPVLQVLEQKLEAVAAKPDIITISGAQVSWAELNSPPSMFDQLVALEKAKGIQVTGKPGEIVIANGVLKVTCQELKDAFEQIEAMEPATDPYAELKTAWAAGAVLELTIDGVKWQEMPKKRKGAQEPNWRLPPEQYRIGANTPMRILKKLVGG